MEKKLFCIGLFSIASVCAWAQAEVETGSEVAQAYQEEMEEQDWEAEDYEPEEDRE